MVDGLVVGAKTCGLEDEVVAPTYLGTVSVRVIYIP